MQKALRLSVVAVEHPLPLPNSDFRAAPPPHLRGEGARVNHFDKKFLNSFHVPGAPALETDGTLNIVTNQHNNDQLSSPLSLSPIPQPLTRFHPVWIRFLQGFDIFLRETLL
jgi:hypothetical protein